MKQCRVCLETKSIEDFPKRSAMCRICHNAYTREHYQNNKSAYAEKARRNSAIQIAKNKQFVVRYKAEHPCTDCGNPDIEVLQFDHKDQDSKVAEVGTMLGGSTERLIVEIEKCDVRCANCHARRTRRQLGHWTSAKWGEGKWGQMVWASEEYAERLKAWRIEHNFEV